MIGTFNKLRSNKQLHALNEQTNQLAKRIRDWSILKGDLSLLPHNISPIPYNSNPNRRRPSYQPPLLYQISLMCTSLPGPASTPPPHQRWYPVPSAKPKVACIQSICGYIRSLAAGGIHILSTSLLVSCFQDAFVTDHGRGSEDPGADNRFSNPIASMR